MYHDKCKTYWEFEVACCNSGHYALGSVRRVDKHGPSAHNAYMMFGDLPAALGVWAELHDVDHDGLNLSLYCRQHSDYTELGSDDTNGFHLWGELRLAFQTSVSSTKGSQSLSSTEWVTLRKFDVDDWYKAWKLYDLITKLPASCAMIAPVAPSLCTDKLDEDLLDVRWRTPDAMCDVTDSDD